MKVIVSGEEIEEKQTPRFGGALGQVSKIHWKVEFRSWNVIHKKQEKAAHMTEDNTV
jgi:hypothetical protein